MLSHLKTAILQPWSSQQANLTYLRLLKTRKKSLPDSFAENKMADGSSFIQQLDQQLEKLLADWSIYTTIIFLSLVAYLLYPVFFHRDPDVHPLLLSRQANVAPIRQPGESAIYRAPDIPYGYPLRSGLNVKDPGAPRWQSGRDGDIRDVWKQAIKGPVDSEGNSSGVPGKIVTILGTEAVVELGFVKLTKELNAVGKYVKEKSGSRVAVYLPNSAEFVVTLFASAFYGLTPILIPQGRSSLALADILKKTQADVLVAAAGTISLTELVTLYSGLKQVIWVVERSSRHIDWNEVPEVFGGKADVAAWHDIVDQKETTSDLPPDLPGNSISDIVVVDAFEHDGVPTSVDHHVTQKNIVAAIAAQLSVLPRNHRLGPADLVLPLDSLSNIWTLTIVLGAIFSNSSLALTSVTAQKAKYDIALRTVSPTVVIASTQTMTKAYHDWKATASSLPQKFRHWLVARSLSSGIMPKPSSIPPRPRLIYISNRLGGPADAPPLEPYELFELRILTGAQIIYALTEPSVAGAIAQTNLLDYRHHANELSRHAHFGPPLSSVEIKLIEVHARNAHEEDATPWGHVDVTGPAVVGGHSRFPISMTFTDSHTLAYG